jgi:RNase P subunit RPR2
MIMWTEYAPKCPYCNEVLFDLADCPMELDKDGDSTNVECECGRIIEVHISISYSFGVEEKA